MNFRNNGRTLNDWSCGIPFDGEIFGEYLEHMRELTKGKNIPPWSNRFDSIKYWKTSFAEFLRTARIPLIRNV